MILITTIWLCLEFGGHFVGVLTLEADCLRSILGTLFFGNLHMICGIDPKQALPNPPDDSNTETRLTERKTQRITGC